MTSLCSCLKAHRSDYDDAVDEEFLDGLYERCCLSLNQLERIAEWKFQSDPRRLTRTRNLLKQNSDFEIQDLTSRACRCSDELGALLLVKMLKGLGKAFGSAVLMVQDPCQFTVYDIYAAKAVWRIGYLTDCPYPDETEQNELPWIRFWEPFATSRTEAVGRSETSTAHCGSTLP
jgi:hypothetical protein